MGGSPAGSEERPWARRAAARTPGIGGSAPLSNCRALLARRWQPSPVETPSEASFAPLQPNAAP